LIFGSGAITTTNGLDPKHLIGPIVGGVVGAAAVGGVIALSVIKAQHKDGKVTGSMTLQVPNAASFFSDVTLQDAVKAGIADAAGVPVTYVKAQVQSAGGRRLVQDAKVALQNIRGRRLLEDVKVNYEIDLPKDSGRNADAVEKTLGAKSAADLTTAIQSRVNIAKGLGTTVAVVSNKAGDQPLVTQAPTTTLPPISIGMTTTDNFLNLPAESGGNFNIGSSTPPLIFAREQRAGETDGGSGGVWLGVGAVVAACLIAALVAVCFHKFCNSRKKRGTRKTQDYDKLESLDRYEQARGTMLDLPPSSRDMASPSQYAPDYGSQYTGSQYAGSYYTPQSQYAMAGSEYVGASMAGMTSMQGMQSMPPPPPPPLAGGYQVGGYQASPLANTWAPPTTAALPTYDGLSTSQYGLRPGQPGFNQPGLVGVNMGVAPPTVY
jgi:hypothetical protein